MRNLERLPIAISLLTLWLTGCAEQPQAMRLGDDLVWLDDAPAMTSSMPARCAGKVSVNDHGEMTGAAPLPFDFNQSRLRPDAQEVLDCVAMADSEAPVPLQLQGHTDSIGSRHYNQALGERRADSAAMYLISSGVAGGQMQTQSYGETRPVASNLSAEGRALNRRVEIIPLESMSADPARE